MTRKTLVYGLLALAASLCAFGEDWGIFEPGKVTVNGYQVSHWSCECNISMLDEIIPQTALVFVRGEKYDADGNVIPWPEIKLKDFALKVWYSLDGTKAIVLLGAREFKVGRTPPVGLDQIQMWLNYLTPYGYTIDKWLTDAQREEKLNSAEYKENP